MGRRCLQTEEITALLFIHPRKMDEEWNPFESTETGEEGEALVPPSDQLTDGNQCKLELPAPLAAPRLVPHLVPSLNLSPVLQRSLP